MCGTSWYVEPEAGPMPGVRAQNVSYGTSKARLRRDVQSSRRTKRADDVRVDAYAQR